MRYSARMHRVLLLFLLVPMSVTPASAQAFETTGTRALGMGGAFVAVADDVSATWWNPAGLATGPFFSLILEHARFDTERQSAFGLPQPADRGALFLGAASLPLGLTYVRTTEAYAASGPADEAIVRGLTTHQAGVTVVQSLSDTIVLAATLKYVRGIAVTGPLGAGESPGDAAADLDGDGSNAFDADIGLLATAGRLKAGVTVRNALSPSFETGAGARFELPWRARAGVSYLVSSDLLMAVDVDLRAVETAFEKARNLAAGAEWRVAGSSRFAVRAGARVDTIGDSRPLGTVGASYAVRNGMWVDVWAAGGAETADRGWGVAGRILY